MPGRSFWHNPFRQQGRRLFAGRSAGSRDRRSERQSGRNGARRIPELMARMGGMGKRNFGRTAASLREDFPLGKQIPNGLTLLGLCSGTTAIPFAAIFDLLDGRVARLFHVDSAFGAQLDSLADLVSFGIAPSVLVYLWSLHKAQSAGWAVALIYCACAAIRLARFNVEASTRDPLQPPNPHFTGLPTPAAACLILLPLLLGFQFHASAFANP